MTTDSPERIWLDPTSEDENGLIYGALNAPRDGGYLNCDIEYVRADLCRPDRSPAGEVRPGEEWDPEMGAVVWWRFPVDEPAWIGTPDDSDWPGYHTHFAPHPAIPGAEPAPAPEREDLLVERMLNALARLADEADGVAEHALQTSETESEKEQSYRLNHIAQGVRMARLAALAAYEESRDG